MALETTIKRINQIIVAALVLLPLVFIPVEQIIDFFYLPKVVVMFLLTYTYIFILVKNRNHFNQLVHNDNINKALLGYLILLIISLFFSRDIFFAIVGYPKRWEGIITLIMYMILFIAARNVKEPDNMFFKGVFFTSCIVAAFGIFQYYGMDPFPRDQWRGEWVGMAFSTIGNPNFLGTYIVLMIPLSMHLFIVKKKNYASVGFGILLYCLLCTMTRGAWLGAIVSIISYFAFLWIYREKYTGTLRRAVVISILSFFIILGFNLQSGNEFLRRFLSIKDIVPDEKLSEKGGSGRLFIWERVVELIAMKPMFGHGIENLAIPFSEFYKEDIVRFWGNSEVMFDKAHNEYLQIAVSSGIPSLIAYITFIIMVLKKGYKRLKNELHILPLMAAVLGYLVQAFFNISVVSVAYVYWIFLGLMCGSQIEKQQL